MERQKNKKTRQGVVVSDRMQKTVTVEVIRRVQHPVYKKFISIRKRFKAHDGSDACGIGDLVLIEETRPLSKTKRWRIREIVKRAN